MYNRNRTRCSTGPGTASGRKDAVSVTGDVPLRLALLELHASNELTFRLIGYAICLLMAVILFRGVVAVLVVAAAPAIGVFWSSAFLHYFGWEHNPFQSGGPAGTFEPGRIR